MNPKNKAFTGIIAGLIILAGLLIMLLMIKMRSAPQKMKAQNPGILVEVIHVTKKDYQSRIFGTGTVRPKMEISIIPEVNGKIIRTSPHFLTGGLVTKNEILFEIEDTDYVYEFEQAKAALAKAQIDFETVKSKEAIAKKEWMNLGIKEKPNPLVLYEPQVKEAQAKIDSALAAVEKAKLNLERTTYKAPYDSLILEESADIGQYIRSGTAIGTLAGTDMAEIIVPLPLDELHWVQLPENHQAGSEASIFLEINGEKLMRTGVVTRLIGELDEKGRMVRIAVKIPDPYNRKSNKTIKEKLMFGMYVSVMVHGKTLQNVYVIPRSGLREDNTVWLVDKDNKLRIQNVKVARKEKDAVIISHGLADHDRIVTTNIIGAADAMQLRLAK